VGGRDFPRETYDETSLLEIFDLNENQWVQGHDIEGNLTRRIGHSACSWNKNVYVFGGETTPDTVHCRIFLNDLYRISFKDDDQKILQCEKIEQTSSSKPSARAWHASTLVKYTTSPEKQKEDSLLIMGGKDDTNFLSDIWILTSESSTTDSSISENDEVTSKSTSKMSLKWTQLTPSGPSPLPLANHTLVPFDDGSKVLVIGGRSSNSTRLNSAAHILDLEANKWSSLSLSSNIEGRFGHTSVALTLPIDENTGEILPVFEENQVSLEESKKDLVLIYGGITDTRNASTTSILLLDPVKGSVYELSLPYLGFESYIGHATITSEDKRSLFIFGGIDSRTGHHLDTTSYILFWEKQAPDSIASYKSYHNQKQTITFPNGDIYEGFLDEEDHKTGEGKCIYANGDIYEGTWENDLKSGQGTMRYANGNIYIGLWSQDVPEGEGILEIQASISSTSRQEIKYVGTFSNGKRNGKGSLTFSDQSILHGSWQDGTLSPTAQIEKYDDGNGICSYSGEVQEDGIPHGQGTSEHTTETYVGLWHQGKRNGQGMLTFKDGTVYHGAFRNGKCNGFGTCQYARTKDRYEGKWIGGSRCGKGTCKYANGSEYKGEWKDDQCHGKGIFTFGNGQSYQGVWKENHFIGENAFEVNQLLEEIEFIASNRINVLKLGAGSGKVR
jgi:hypothetical protein